MCAKKIHTQKLINNFYRALAHQNRFILFCVVSERTTLADIELETKVLGADQLNDSSAARFYKARCKKLEEDIAVLAKKCAINVSSQERFLHCKSFQKEFF